MSSLRASTFALISCISCTNDLSGSIAVGLGSLPDDVASTSVFVLDVEEGVVVSSATVSSAALSGSVALGVPAERLLDIVAVARTSSAVPSWRGHVRTEVPLRREPTAVSLRLFPAGVLAVDTTRLENRVWLRRVGAPSDEEIAIEPEGLSEFVLESGRYDVRSREPLWGGRGIWIERKVTSEAILRPVEHVDDGANLAVRITNAEGIDVASLLEGDRFFLDVTGRSRRARWSVGSEEGTVRELPARVGPFSMDSRSTRVFVVDEPTGVYATAVAELEGPAESLDHIEFAVADPAGLDRGTDLWVEAVDSSGRRLTTTFEGLEITSDDWAFFPEPISGDIEAPVRVPLIRSSWPAFGEVRVSVNATVSGVGVTQSWPLPSP